MKYLSDHLDGSRISGIYFCKNKINATTKNGKSYYNVTLQDKSGVMDGKIWDVNSDAIAEFETGDFIDVVGDVSLYNGAMQATLRRVRVAHEDEYQVDDYLPKSRYNIEAMYEGLLKFIGYVNNPYYKKLLDHFFVEDEKIIKLFKSSSAAKSIHHGFIGGLLEHSLSVVRLCQVYTKAYTFLDADLLLTGAILHDIGKLKELSQFPENDYTDEGQLLGHIMIGAEMIHDACKEIDGFPGYLEDQLKHLILAHHGELEYGSPKKPALVEAVALSLADLTDARMESFREVLDANAGREDWLGFNRVFDSNIRKTKTYAE